MATTAVTLKKGWSHGSAKSKQITRIWHYFKRLSDTSVCNHVKRDESHEVTDKPTPGFLCGRCEIKFNENRQR